MMSLRKYMLIGLGIFLLTALMSTLSGLHNLNRSNTSLNGMNQEVGVILSVIDPIIHSRTFQVHLSHYVYERNSGAGEQRIAEYLAQAKAVLAKADAAFDNFSATALLADEKDLRARYRASYLALRQQGLQPLLAAAERNDDSAYDSAQHSVGELTRVFEKNLDAELLLHERYSQQMNEMASRDLRTGMAISAVLLIFTFVLMAWMLFIVRRKLISPLHQAVSLAEHIERGDLTSQLNASSNIKEVAQLSRAMRSMNGQLSSMVGGIRTIVSKVQEASGEIALRNQHLDRRTHQQSCAVVETAASMEEITATVKNTTDNVKKASQLSHSVLTNAAKGGEVIAEVVTTMNEIADSSERINDITNVINGIAAQTNILALNAAVEAARAGDQGRGFAVVAGEVRNLAQRSSEAAKEIAGLIDESRSRVKTGTERVNHAGASMSEILQQVSEVNQLMNDIAEASDQQSKGIEQIGQAIHELDTTTQQNADLVRQSSNDASTLEQDAGHLASMVKVFRVAS
ncbi:methyl-accepting chemotaxis protein [Erwinia aphidicola]|uniref:methyl-accepting chemotaxis protein n=1 Tax=Erwinia aphidicola TaxID=68334 RepID=UPI0017463166|nr:methyl-accepting chemotaxis protein [Erwinia aphidicola]MBD1378381.1 Tar ligand binding domain-containing protein [Erwinia aphidicola]